MKRAGRFGGQIIREYGAPIGPGDAIMALAAIELDEPVVTDNVNDLEKVPSAALGIVTY